MPIQSTINTEPELIDSDIIETLNANHLYTRNQIELFTKFSRFGFFDVYNTNTISKEYIFFTKMDLHLFEQRTQTLNPELENNPFFTNCYTHYRDTMNQLQLSTKDVVDNSPFCNLLSNSIISNIDLQDISIDELETASNIYKTRLKYPLATTTPNNIGDFNLEFQDTKFLDVYMFFKIWYEYEVLKNKGLVTPPNQEYTLNKIIHDQMSVYKIIVGEDMETIIHWSKFWGVYPNTIPRSTFSELREGPINLAVTFSYQWVEDMDPNILSDFNMVVQDKKSKYNEDIPIYNKNINMANGTWCNVPYIIESELHNRKVYKLKWR